MLSGTLRGEGPTPSHSDLCTLLAMVANAVNKRPVTLWTFADDVTPLAANQMLIGRTPGATMEHYDDPEERNEISTSEPDEKKSVTEDVNVPEEMLGDTATQEDVTADDASSHDLSDSTKEAGLEDVNETKGDAHDELLKDITSQEDVTTDEPLNVLPKRSQRLLETAMKDKDT